MHPIYCKQLTLCARCRSRLFPRILRQANAAQAPTRTSTLLMSAQSDMSTRWVPNLSHTHSLTRARALCLSLCVSLFSVPSTLADTDTDVLPTQADACACWYIYTMCVRACVRACVYSCWHECRCAFTALCVLVVNLMMKVRVWCSSRWQGCRSLLAENGIKVANWSHKNRYIWRLGRGSHSPFHGLCGWRRGRRQRKSRVTARTASRLHCFLTFSSFPLLSFLFYFFSLLFLSTTGSALQSPWLHQSLASWSTMHSAKDWMHTATRLAVITAFGTCISRGYTDDSRGFVHCRNVPRRLHSNFQCIWRAQCALVSLQNIYYIYTGTV